MPYSQLLMPKNNTQFLSCMDVVSISSDLSNLDTLDPFK